MTRARATLVSVEDTPYYHCIGRCVRRAFLCGFDEFTQRSYEHRRTWISERLRVLTDAFAIDICAYALMSNHYHLVVKLDPESAASWSAREVIERWLSIFSGTELSHRFLKQECLDNAEQRSLDADIETWRSRLGDLSWFMKCLNEHIARRANAEDGCTGHFWESRYRSQALLDEAALVTAMAYVDLNPIRAEMADSVQGSDFTSGQDRWRDSMEQPHAREALQRPRLLPFVESEHEDALDYLPFTLKDYLDLVDETGRLIVDGKRGFIPGKVPTLIESLSINETDWLDTARQLQARFELAMGQPSRLRQLAKRWGKRWLRGNSSAKRFYLPPEG